MPDLEGIARAYLRTLEHAAGGHERARHDYEWMMLELYDQTVRESSGGCMATYMGRDELPNKEFVVARVGLEVERAVESAERSRGTPAPPPPAGRLRVFRRLRRVLTDRAARREALVRRLLGAETSCSNWGASAAGAKFTSGCMIGIRSRGL